MEGSKGYTASFTYKSVLTFGIRVDPPTSTISSIWVFFKSASSKARLTVFNVFLKTSSLIWSTSRGSAFPRSPRRSTAPRSRWSSAPGMEMINFVFAQRVSVSLI